MQVWWNGEHEKGGVDMGKTIAMLEEERFYALGNTVSLFTWRRK